MEGKSSMAEKKPAPTLPVSMAKPQQQQQARAALPFRLVNLWTFFNAIAVTISFGVGVAYYTLVVTFYPNQASWLLPRAATTKVTDAEGNLASALATWMLWCSTPQAAAGALALLLPCHRWRVRRAAAYAALALTVASHCMCADGVRVVVRADPEGLFFKIVGTAGIFVCAVGDLVGFLALLRFCGGEEAEDDLLGFVPLHSGPED